MRVKSAADIGALIRSARKRAGLSQRDLALRVDAGTRWVSLIENGHPTAELGRVLRALQTLGVDLDADVPDAPKAASSKPALRATAPGLDDLDSIVAAHKRGVTR
jgi:HTH-type transcriptional regulator/antitoxin HipB